MISVPLLQKNFVPSLLTPKKSEREALEFPEFILGACSVLLFSACSVLLFSACCCCCGARSIDLMKKCYVSVLVSAVNL